MTSSARFELFAFWRTSATYRVRVAMNLKGLEAEERIVNLEAGEQRSEAFLKINPLGAIPALLDHEAPDQGALTQSLAILEFLDEIAPTPALLPADPHGRARVRSLCAMLAADTHPLIVPRIRKYLTTTAGFTDEALARVADALVHDGPAGDGSSAGGGGTDRHVLSWRCGDERGHLPGQHHRGDASV